MFLIGNGHGAVAERDGGGGVHRVHTRRVGEFGDVVDAITIDVGRGGDEVGVTSRNGNNRTLSDSRRLGKRRVGVHPSLASGKAR